MKVVHITTFYHSGAGIAAYRIHEALLQQNVDSTFLSLDLLKSDGTVSALQFKKSRVSLLKKLFYKCISVAENRLSLALSKRTYYERRLRKVLPDLKCERTSLPFSKCNILEHPAVRTADIIHLHWVSGFLNYPSFFKNNTKPVVWTFHDMNPFQGIFHYKTDELRNYNVAGKLDEKIREIKTTLIKSRNFSLSIVSPSRWLLDAALNSPGYKEVPAICIRNPLNTFKFYPDESLSLRQNLSIPADNTIFLFVAEVVESHRKGFALLIEALQELGDSSITLLAIGTILNLEAHGLHIINIGRITDNDLLRQYYSMADAFVIPSLEDNLPNVMLESMACGTPVLSFDIGGMSEIIVDYVNGLKAKEVSGSSLKDLLNEFILNKEKFNSVAIRSFALQSFSEEVIGKEYSKNYLQTLNAISRRQLQQII